MKTTQVLQELEAIGSERYKQMLMRNHGVSEPCFGVKIGDLKKIQKRIKTDHELALYLYDTGNYDAMYLAGLIADDARMTPDDLQRWAENARGGALPSATVAWVAAGNPHGWDMALKWIESPNSHVAEAGWHTLGSLTALKNDAELDLPALKKLVEYVAQTIHSSPDAVRYAMNAFLIAVGCYVLPLTQFVIRTAKKIGPVSADLGDNQCQIPFAPDYIAKVEQRGALGKKRKTVKC